ncbi:MAG: MBL fold metallo-hydrolase [Anaerolineales bacterium]|jgi:glyoxylase-like metal-dependent hydrolase (beta-lactamase superfamily II)
MEIIPHVHYLNLIGANVFLIVEEDSLTLIDAGLPFYTRRIFSYIRSICCDPADLKTILITHADFDHVGSVKALKKASGAKVCASQAAAEAMVEGISSRELKFGKVFTPLISTFEKLFHLPRIDVDEILSPGQILPILGGLEVIDTPGHTPGHLSYYAKGAGVLFVGDSLRTRPGETLYNLYPAITWDRDKAIASTRRQKELNPKVVCSGHGPVVYAPEMRFPD